MPDQHNSPTGPNPHDGQYPGRRHDQLRLRRDPAFDPHASMPHAGAVPPHQPGGMVPPNTPAPGAPSARRSEQSGDSWLFQGADEPPAPQPAPPYSSVQPQAPAPMQPQTHAPMQPRTPRTGSHSEDQSWLLDRNAEPPASVAKTPELTEEQKGWLLGLNDNEVGRAGMGPVVPGTRRREPVEALPAHLEASYCEPEPPSRAVSIAATRGLAVFTVMVIGMVAWRFAASEEVAPTESSPLELQRSAAPKFELSRPDETRNATEPAGRGTTNAVPRRPAQPSGTSGRRAVAEPSEISSAGDDTEAWGDEEDADPATTLAALEGLLELGGTSDDGTTADEGDPVAAKLGDAEFFLGNPGGRGPAADAEVTPSAETEELEAGVDATAEEPSTAAADGTPEPGDAFGWFARAESEDDWLRGTDASPEAPAGDDWLAGVSRGRDEAATTTTEDRTATTSPGAGGAPEGDDWVASLGLDREHEPQTDDRFARLTESLDEPPVSGPVRQDDWLASLSGDSAATEDTTTSAPEVWTGETEEAAPATGADEAETEGVEPEVRGEVDGRDEDPFGLFADSGDDWTPKDSTRTGRALSRSPSEDWSPGFATTEEADPFADEDDVFDLFGSTDRVMENETASTTEPARDAEPTTPTVDDVTPEDDWITDLSGVPSTTPWQDETTDATEDDPFELFASAEPVWEGSADPVTEPTADVEPATPTMDEAAPEDDWITDLSEEPSTTPWQDETTDTTEEDPFELFANTEPVPDAELTTPTVGDEDDWLAEVSEESPATTEEGDAFDVFGTADLEETDGVAELAIDPEGREPAVEFVPLEDDSSLVADSAEPETGSLDEQDVLPVDQADDELAVVHDVEPVVESNESSPSSSTDEELTVWDDVAVAVDDVVDPSPMTDEPITDEVEVAEVTETLPPTVYEPIPVEDDSTVDWFADEPATDDVALNDPFVSEPDDEASVDWFDDPTEVAEVSEPLPEPLAETVEEPLPSEDDAVVDWFADEPAADELAESDEPTTAPDELPGFDWMDESSEVAEVGESMPPVTPVTPEPVADDGSVDWFETPTDSTQVAEVSEPQTEAPAGDAWEDDEWTELFDDREDGPVAESVLPPEVTPEPVAEWVPPVEESQAQTVEPTPATDDVRMDDLGEDPEAQEPVESARPTRDYARASIDPALDPRTLASESVPVADTTEISPSRDDETLTSGPDEREARTVQVPAEELIPSGDYEADLRREEAVEDHWYAENIPMDALDGPRRVLTPQVGEVRVIFNNGEVFRGKLFGVGMGIVWVENNLGRMTLDGSRVARIERVRKEREERKQDEEGGGELLKVRVRTAGGVFTGQQISRKGDQITLMTDEGYRITLTSDDVEEVTARTSKKIGISGRRD